MRVGLNSIGLIIVGFVIAFIITYSMYNAKITKLATEIIVLKNVGRVTEAEEEIKCRSTQLGLLKAVINKEKLSDSQIKSIQSNINIEEKALDEVKKRLENLLKLENYEKRSEK